MFPTQLTKFLKNPCKDFGPLERWGGTLPDELQKFYETTDAKYCQDLT